MEQQYFEKVEKVLQNYHKNKGTTKRDLMTEEEKAAARKAAADKAADAAADIEILEKATAAAAEAADKVEAVAEKADEE